MSIKCSFNFFITDEYFVQFATQYESYYQDKTQITII